MEVDYNGCLFLLLAEGLACSIFQLQLALWL